MAKQSQSCADTHGWAIADSLGADAAESELNTDSYPASLRCSVPSQAELPPPLNKSHDMTLVLTVAPYTSRDQFLESPTEIPGAESGREMQQAKATHFLVCFQVCYKDFR